MAEGGKAKVPAAGSAKKSEGGSSQERIIAQFEQLRQEQRAIANKIAELEGDLNEHRWNILFNTHVTPRELVWCT